MSQPKLDAVGLMALREVPSLRHRVHEALESLIVRRELAPGTRLVEGELAETFAVSRGPIREALQSLARDGFVDLRPRQGAFVHVPTAQEVDDFFDVRRTLEVESARQAAVRITSEDVELLRASVRRGEQVLSEGGDPSTDVEATPFHHLVADIARNQVLIQILLLLGRRSNWYLSPFSPERRKIAWEEHGRIVDAIVSGRAAEAGKAMAQHIDGGRRAFKALQESDG